MRRDFKTLYHENDYIQVFKDGWPSWSEKIVKLGDVESLSRPLIRKMVATIKASDSVSNKEGRSRCMCTDTVLTYSVMTQQFYLFICFC